MRNVVETAGDISIQNPFAASLFVQGAMQLDDSIHAASTRPETIGVGLKTGFPLWLQRCLNDGLIDAVPNSWNPQGTRLLTVALGDIHSPHWLRAVTLEAECLAGKGGTCCGCQVDLTIYPWRAFALVFLRDPTNRQQLVGGGTCQKLLQTAYSLPLLVLGGAVDPFLEPPDPPLSLAPVNLVPSQRWLTGLFNEDRLHRLTSPIMRTSHDLLYRQDLPEVSTLSGWVFPGWRPCPGNYCRAFAFSGILYPLRHRCFLRSSYHGLAWGGWGLPRSVR